MNKVHPPVGGRIIPELFGLEISKIYFMGYFLKISPEFIKMSIY